MIVTHQDKKNVTQFLKRVIYREVLNFSKSPQGGKMKAKSRETSARENDLKTIQQKYVCRVKKDTEAEKQYQEADKEFREVFSSKKH
jgi:hypothetical protein